MVTWKTLPTDTMHWFQKLKLKDKQIGNLTATS